MVQKLKYDELYNTTYTWAHGYGRYMVSVDDERHAARYCKGYHVVMRTNMVGNVFSHWYWDMIDFGRKVQTLKIFFQMIKQRFILDNYVGILLCTIPVSWAGYTLDDIMEHLRLLGMSKPRLDKAYGGIIFRIGQA